MKIEGDDLLIRANQGHTMKNVDNANKLTRIENSFNFTQACFGTYRKNL